MIKKDKESITQVLKKYVPEVFIEDVVELLFSEKVRFVISKPRKTKLGDYRPPKKEGDVHRISVNSDLNPYSFLITTIHEFAHMTTFIKYGRKVQAHGEEWKSEFKRLLIPILKKKELPQEIEWALLRSLNNLKASSCTDIHLFRALKKHDESEKDIFLLENLNNNSYFKINNKIFQRGVLRRTRYLCKEVKTGRQFLVSRLAEVQPINEKNERK